MLYTALNPPVKGFIETSFLDWKECLSSVIFLGGCNFRCPYCHNKELVLNHVAMEDIPMEYIIASLRKYKKWIDRVVITGGEPTISMSLFDLTGRLKSEKMLIKLDTNGSNPQILKGLVNDGLIDYVAMDVKGPVDRYSRWSGVNLDIKRIQESIEFLLEGSIDYEFRMTVVPGLHQKEDIQHLSSQLGVDKRFVLQNFNSENPLDPSLKDTLPYDSKVLKEMEREVQRMV